VAVKTTGAGRRQTQRSRLSNRAPEIYAQNIVKAFFAYLDGNGDPAPLLASQSQPSGVNSLYLPYILFLQDYPVSSNVRGLITDVGAQAGVNLFAGQSLNNEATWQTQQWGNPNTHHNNIFNASLDTYGARQRAFGPTNTNTVDVGAYMMTALSPNEALQAAGASGGDPPLTVFLLADHIGESGVCAGNPLNFQGGLQGDPAPEQQIILQESDYTQAMYDNGNTHVGTSPVVWTIVGLWGPDNVLV